MSEEIRRAVGLLAPTEGVVEIRALADGVTHSGYFDDHEALARGVEALDADPSVAGIYVTLNSVNPALLARRANRIKLRLSRKDATTADADILRRRWPRRSGSRHTSRSRGSLLLSKPTPGTGRIFCTGPTSKTTNPRPRL